MIDDLFDSGIMNVVLYMGFSMLETSAMFYLIFKVYKIDFFAKEVIFASAIMSFVSYSLRNTYGLPELDVTCQVGLMFLFIWMLFRIHVFYAAIMTGIIYQGYSLLQTTLYLIMQNLGIFEMNLPGILEISTYTLQTASAFTAYMLGWYMSTRNIGFDFVPDKPRGRIEIKRQDRILFALVLPSYIIVVATIYFAKYLFNLFFILPFGYAVVLYTYMYFSYKKDRAEL